MNLTALLHRLMKMAAVDAAIAFSASAKLITNLLAPISLLMIARCLSPDEQGFYYTFSSVLGVQVLFDLGVSSVVTHLSSHEAPHQPASQGLHDEQSLRSMRRLAELWKGATLYFAAATALSAAILVAGGSQIFSVAALRAGGVSWQAPWVALVLLTGGIAICTPTLSLLEGLGSIESISRLRLQQGVVGCIVLWIGLGTGLRLWAAPIVAGANLSLLLIWLYRNHKQQLLVIHRHRSAERLLKWKEEVIPLQWRVAISTASGYLILQLAVPVLLRYHNAQSAGQMGMTLGIVTSCLFMAAAWTNTKWGFMGSMVASQRYRELDSMFWRSLRTSVGVFTACIVLILFAISVAQQLWPEVRVRVLPPLETVGVALLSCSIHIVSNLAAYGRAHKTEPLPWVLAAFGLGSASLMWGFGRHFGAAGIAWSGAGVGWLLIVPIAVWRIRAVVFRLRSEGHN